MSNVLRPLGILLGCILIGKSSLILFVINFLPISYPFVMAETSNSIPVWFGIIQGVH